jgi:hypothetical protein
LQQIPRQGRKKEKEKPSLMSERWGEMDVRGQAEMSVSVKAFRMPESVLDVIAEDLPTSGLPFWVRSIPPARRAFTLEFKAQIQNLTHYWKKSSWKI